MEYALIGSGVSSLRISELAKVLKMKTSLIVAGVLLSGSILSGCVGGTTYGTGVTQERQTIEDLSNILKFRKKTKQIDYAARPDLVVPEQKQLVEPQEANVATSNTDWPESPEQRIARIRAEAEEANATTASQNRFAKSQKTLRSVTPGSAQRTEAPIGQGVPNVSCDPDGVGMRRCTGGEISRAVRAQRDEIASVGKTGYSRRYLTEPPIEYRTPADTAPIGDEGYSEAELKKIEAERKKREWEESTKPQ